MEVLRYWVWYERSTAMLSVGRGDTVGEDIIMWWTYSKDEHVIYDVKYFSFSSWNTAVHYRNIAVPAITEPQSPPSKLSVPGIRSNYDTWYPEWKGEDDGSVALTLEANVSDLVIGLR